VKWEPTISFELERAPFQIESFELSVNEGLNRETRSTVVKEQADGVFHRGDVNDATVPIEIVLV